MKLKVYHLIFFALFVVPGFSQTPTQNLRGKIIDKVTQAGLPGVNVHIFPLNLTVSSNPDGSFSFPKLPIGRYSLLFSLVGYDKSTLANIELGSGKETILSVELSESVTTLNELVVHKENLKDQTINDMVVVSGRQFSVQESNRYAGGYADASRMVMSFAGVTSSGNDQNNEIVIRGNSPKGLLWRIEGVEIPNPNHFGDGQGSTSGIISMLNSASLANSDFLTGAFPSEYGNALSGVFDLKFRRGNNQKHEFMAQLSVIGIETSAEGPISKKGASYRFNFRYSTLELLLKSGLLKIETGGFSPAYRDMNFTLNFPTKKLGTFALWGFGGLNLSDDKDLNSVQNNQGKTGVIGLSNTYSLGKKGYLYSVLMASRERSKEFEEILLSNKNWVVNKQKLFQYDNLRFSSFYNYKISSKASLRTGLVFSNLGYEFDDNRRDNSRNRLVNFLFENDNKFFFQAYSQLKFNINRKISFSGGIHYNKFLLNNNQTFEPRLAAKYQTNRKNAFSAGFGLHSRLEPISVYLLKRQKTGEIFEKPNKNLGLTRAAHYVVGYHRVLNPNWNLKIEAYYQKLFQIPIDTSQRSLFSILNASAGLIGNVMTNEGEGENKGIELTLERYFYNNYYFMFTGSLFDSKFLARDGKWRNTVFNNTYAGNILGGKEFSVSKQKNKFLVINSRLIWRGGNRYIPINLAESIKRNTTVNDVTKAFEPRLPNYWRIDLGLALKINLKKATWALSADIQNLTNRKNIIQERYNTSTNNILYNYALPLLPIFSFKVDF
ncbi:MAG: hypothetical protein CFE22_09390 [Cytophagaceae bacterium BCCC1]|nr:MAG: hypothetical protein CFE22_09390 [Cytophagaceae bacterium BCCC1]